MTTKSRDIPKTHNCDVCNYISSKHSDYIKHCNTVKHMKRVTTSIQHEKSLDIYTCLCGKEYNHRASLWNHKKKCKGILQESEQSPVTSVLNPVDSSLVIELLKQNQEFKEMMIDQHKRMTDQQQKMTDQQHKMAEQQDTIIALSKNAGNTINNTNNTINNNKFNLNVFLNETCKDAINLNDFIQSIELTISDFINTGEVGYVKGISDIMLERFRNMDPHTRPIHCTDLKRETIYVKDSDIWAKEDANNTHIRKAVRIVANKNKEQIHSWIQENPNYDVLDTPECDKFFEYSKASLGGYGREEDSRFENKIISNILTETTIDKRLLE